MNDKHTWKLIVTGVLLLCVMVGIYILSDEPATQSAALSSNFLKTFLGRMIEKLLPPLTGEGIHKDIRKLAHIFEYFCLGSCAALFFRELWRESPLRVTSAAAELFSLLYSVSDEYHQTFIPGRSGQVRDVLFDLSGITAGVLLLSLLIVLAGKRRKRRPV